MAKKKPPLHPTPLTKWPVGVSGMVVSLQVQDKRQLQKLITLGIIPHTQITLLRKNPCWIIQIGYTRIALDNSIAKAIILH